MEELDTQKNDSKQVNLLCMGRCAQNHKNLYQNPYRSGRFFIQNN